MGETVPDRSVLCARNLAELCPAVIWQAKFVNDEIGYVGEEISKHC